VECKGYLRELLVVSAIYEGISIIHAVIVELQGHLKMEKQLRESA